LKGFENPSFVMLGLVRLEIQRSRAAVIPDGLRRKPQGQIRLPDISRRTSAVHKDFSRPNT
jgi:hypothetical protein